MSWHSSGAFLLFIPLVLLLLWLFKSRKKKRPSIQMSTLKGIKAAPRGLRAKIASWPRGLYVAAVALAILALARPQMSDTKVKRNVEGIDIVIALDISDSMLIEDMKPNNRLEASKKIIKEFVAQRVSDRIGLVVFSGESYTRVPLTLDYPVLQESLAAVKTTRNMKMGTAIGVALANAVGRLKESTAKSRVIIFLTDGENNSGTIDPETALDIAKGYGIKIYSIGMGTDGEAMLPVYVKGIGGRMIKRYQPMHSKVNVELLTKMAKETGGAVLQNNKCWGLKISF